MLLKRGNWCRDHCEAFKSRSGGEENGTVRKVEELSSEMTALQIKSCLKSYLMSVETRLQHGWNPGVVAVTLLVQAT